MSDKVQAILLKIILNLKNNQWKVDSDWEITLKSEGHVSLRRNIPVHGDIGESEWDDEVETIVDLKLASRDEITFFPEFTIYANIFINGGPSKDIAYKMDADVAFTEHDVRNDKKAETASQRISRLVEDHIENEYSDYIDQNSQEIINYRQGGWKADEED